MRIRKNARFSSLIALAYPRPLQPHVCQLNQSPWDVIRFSNDSSPPKSSFNFQPRLHHQCKRDDNLIGDASFDKFLGAVDIYNMVCAVIFVGMVGNLEIVTDDDFNTRKWKHEEAPDDNHDDGDDDNNTDDDNSYYQVNDKGGRSSSTFGKMKGCCKITTNGKERQCSKEPKEGYYLRERHLKPRQNTNNSLSGAFGFVEPFASFAKKVGPGRQGRPSKKGSFSKSPKANKSNLFYYYSEFNPLWGRRQPRRPRGVKDRGGKREQQRGFGTPPPSTWVSREEEKIDYTVVCGIDEEEEEEGIDGVSNVGGSWKRARKLVKARPLKSLM